MATNTERENHHMISSSIDALLGLRVTAHNSVEGYEQLIFGSGIAMLSIYNRYGVFGPRAEFNPSITCLIGLRLIALVNGLRYVHLSFEGGWLLDVDIREEAFTGPEAMVLHWPGRSPIVWR